MSTQLLRILLVLLWIATRAAWAADDLIARQSAQLPERPLRIITLDDVATELVTSLGLAPVGVANLAGYRRYVGLGADLLKDSQPLGSIQQPDLEAIARLRPDLILGSGYLHLGLFRRLESLGPTLLYRYGMDTADDDAVARASALLSDLGRRVGRTAEATAVNIQADRALADTQVAAQAAGIVGQPFAVLFPLPQQGVFITLNRRVLINALVRRLGGQDPWPLVSSRVLHRYQDVQEIAAVPDLTALFVGEQTGHPFFRSSLWQAMPLARSGRHASLPSPYWTFGGPASVTMLAHQIATALRGLPPPPNGR
ncbi:ABC transporter substrate-binding protein [Pseudomonas benzopyrenica]|uniref:ABC transporter substrate-binding protein n=1 Tax=Pseudomonas benzopyrenica TaxID=2993566 RepID=UPI0039C16021